ncbi:superoxide dismutase family protein [Terriglobus roseus]|uniref:Superoxide dismutase, Cu-Zn family n=1 Tax=Terriglobus roseus TaxID=392734 RepID=A0A1G7HVH7_9BACT|nr:superoxide dismutase family protein [Terriglobus roseus]SDF04551.1 superoxide dismutase, Cu-Zn family [Terriglobus roseus]
MQKSWMATVVLGACSLTAFAVAQKPVKVELKDPAGKDVGTVEFAKKGKTVDMKVSLHDLPAGEHGIHVHAGDACTAPDFASAKGHLNPDNKHHGYQNPEGHHAGDFASSVKVGADGKGKATLSNPDISLDTASMSSIYGKTVVVHELVDDQKTDPAGASGKRIACGVIPAAAM